MANRDVLTRGLLFEHGSYIARMVVPVDVRSELGKREFRTNLKTAHPGHAAAEAKKKKAEWRALIMAARQANGPEAMKSVVAEWKLNQNREANGLLNRDSLLETYGVNPDDHRAVIGTQDHLDGLAALTKIIYGAVRGQPAPSFLSDALTAAGLDDGPEARRQIGKALLSLENSRMLKSQADHDAAEANAALSQSARSHSRARAFENREFQTDLAPKGRSLVMSGTKISELLKHWQRHKPKNAKEAAKEEHCIRRLTEFMGGDVDTGLVSRVRVGDFWLALKNFPARRNASELAKMNFNQLVATGLPPIGPSALFQWQITFKSIWKHGLKYDLVTDNPFVVIDQKVDKSELEGEPWSPQEIKGWFSGPMFTGHGGDYDRATVGTIVTKDWRWWLPVLSLWSGTRLNEWAAAPLADVRQIGEGWFLDLTNRPVGGDDPLRIKNKGSRRLVPIHQRLIDLGFLEYVRSQTGTHLFPDLHGFTLHPASRAANWFSKVRKPGQKTIHELRHTFKYQVRSTKASEEVSDLITGHQNGSMGRKYGQGVDPAVLTEAVAKVTFPTFPL